VQYPLPDGGQLKTLCGVVSCPPLGASPGGRSGSAL